LQAKNNALLVLQTTQVMDTESENHSTSKFTSYVTGIQEF